MSQRSRVLYFYLLSKPYARRHQQPQTGVVLASLVVVRRGGWQAASPNPPYPPGPAATLSWGTSHRPPLPQRRIQMRFYPAPLWRVNTRFHGTSPLPPPSYCWGWDRTQLLPRNMQIEIKGLPSSEDLPLKVMPSEQRNKVEVMYVALPVVRREGEKSFLNHQKLNINFDPSF